MPNLTERKDTIRIPEIRIRAIVVPDSILIILRFAMCENMMVGLDPSVSRDGVLSAIQSFTLFSKLKTCFEDSVSSVAVNRLADLSTLI